MRALGWILLAVAGACAGGPKPAANALGGGVAWAPPVYAAAAGSVVRLLPATASVRGPIGGAADPGGGDAGAAGTGAAATAAGAADGAEVSTRFLDGLWREAMRQSLHLDVAAAAEDTAAPLAVALHMEAAGGVARLSSTLVRAGEPPLPLAAATGPVPQAVDRLALATRQALGEPLAEAPPAQAAAAVYSDRPACVEATEAGLALAAEGEHHRAVAELRRARTHDPGCTITLMALAKSLLMLGSHEGDAARVDEARRAAAEALALETRGSATTRHRLAHLLLIADGQRSGAGPRADRELLALGELARRERPHDPHALQSVAVALNLLGRYPQSLPLLRRLAARWPTSAEVAYHLAFAELAAGEPSAALAAIQRATPRLPAHTVVVPTALALFHCGKHDELRSYLAGLAADPRYRQSLELHELRRMQAAHALLTDRAGEATRWMLEDLEWIRQRPSSIERYALDIAEVGEVLVQIGRARDLLVPLQAFEALGDLPPTAAQVMVLLGGLIQAAGEGGDRDARAAEAHLAKAGQTVWSSLLRATAHRRRGELMDELRERVFQYQSTEMPLARAALARALEAAGSPVEAQLVLDELRQQLLAFDMRRPRQHPLMSPAAALAYLALPR